MTPLLANAEFTIHSGVSSSPILGTLQLERISDCRGISPIRISEKTLSYSYVGPSGERIIASSISRGGCTSAINSSMRSVSEHPEIPRDNHERRLHARRPVESLASIHLGKDSRALVFNLSEGGVAVRASAL